MAERGFGLLALALGLLVVACKPAPAATTAPRRDITGMDVDAIERELARNEEDLAAAGVYVPTPPAEPATPTTVTEMPEPGTEPEPAPIEEGDDAPEPTQAAPPEPMLEEDSEREVFGRRERRGPRRAEKRKDRREAADRCGRICDLADVTCDLQEQVCALAARHAHDIRYEGACERAELQCDAAARECQTCTLR